MIEIKNLSYSYPPGITALKDINLKITQGELLCVIGPNGCGKSTLLKLMDGLIFANSGEYRYKDIEVTEKSLKDTHNMTRFRSEVSYLFQESESQFFCPTVYDEISFSLRQMDMDEEYIEIRLKNIMERFGIANISKRMPHTLSGGEKKKVALASILAHEPSVVLMDEPTANLDPKTQSFIIDIILELNLSGRTVIIATHDLFFVKEINSKIFLMFDDHTGVSYDNFSILSNNIEDLIRANLIRKNSVYRHAHLFSHKPIPNLWRNSGSLSQKSIQGRSMPI